MDCVCCLKRATSKENNQKSLTFCGLLCQKQYHATIGRSIFDNYLESNTLNRDVFGLILKERFRNDSFGLAYILNETDNLSNIMKWIYQSDALSEPLGRPIGVIRKTLWKHAIVGNFNNLLFGIITQEYEPETTHEELYFLLLRAIYNNNIEGVQYLLGFELEVGGSNNYPLRQAIRFNATEIALLLLDDVRVDKNVFKHVLVQLAKYHNNKIIFDKLME